MKYELIVLGETMRALHDKYPEIAGRLSESRAVINFRNVLVHEYYLVEEEVVWGVVRERVPELLHSLRDTLKELDDHD